MNTLFSFEVDESVELSLDRLFLILDQTEGLHSLEIDAVRLDDHVVEQLLSK